MYNGELNEARKTAWRREAVLTLFDGDRLQRAKWQLDPQLLHVRNRGELMPIGACGFVTDG